MGKQMVGFSARTALERFQKSVKRFWDKKRNKQMNLEAHFDSIEMGNALASNSKLTNFNTIATAYLGNFNYKTLRAFVWHAPISV